MTDSNLHAILIGIDHYSDQRNFNPLHFAEKDARDMQRVLIECGHFPEASTRLILGQAATTNELEKILYTEVRKQRSPEDTVIVYFSGHGFLAGEQGKAYLGTYDATIDEVLDNPRAGLMMDYIHDEIFLLSPAERIIFILDCCHSGAFIPPDIIGSKEGLVSRPARDEIIRADFFSNVKGKGRVAIVSSPKGIPSRESNQLQNGIFTHYVVKGLKGEGEAAEANGEVTVDSLLTYVRRMVSEQPVGRYGQDFGRFVITRVEKAAPLRKKLETASLTADWLAENQDWQLLANPLEGCSIFMEDLVGRLQETCLSQSGEEIQRDVLNILRSLYGAEFAFVFGLDQARLYPKFLSDYPPGCQPELLIQIAAGVAQQMAQNKALKHQPGVLYNYASILAKSGQVGENSHLFLVPLLTSDEPEFLALTGLAADSPLVSDVYATILKSLYHATRGLNSITSSALVEERILDDLKATFNRLPMKLYDRRFALFSRRVDNLIVHFQPIVYLDPDFLHICGWEALARDASTLETPNYLFKVAEQWGPRFCIELDKQIVMIAPPLYRKELSKVPGFRRVEDIKDLSINVYPQSLDSDVYYQMVGESIRQKALPPEYMILEISEKMPVPNPKGLHEEQALAAFRDRLKQYIDDYNIRFAIDDFGVGHSSIFRLASLSLNYIKIDRSVIANVNGVNLLTNTFNLIKGSRWDTPKVVVEGFDEAEDQKVTLNQLHKIGVRYVQGYLVGKIGPGIYRLDRTLETKLSSLLGKPALTSAEEAA